MVTSKFSGRMLMLLSFGTVCTFGYRIYCRFTGQLDSVTEHFDGHYGAVQEIFDRSKRNGIPILPLTPDYLRNNNNDEGDDGSTGDSANGDENSSEIVNTFKRRPEGRDLKDTRFSTSTSVEKLTTRDLKKLEQEEREHQLAVYKRQWREERRSS